MAARPATRSSGPPPPQTSSMWTASSASRASTASVLPWRGERQGGRGRECVCIGIGGGRGGGGRDRGGSFSDDRDGSGVGRAGGGGGVKKKSNARTCPAPPARPPSTRPRCDEPLTVVRPEWGGGWRSSSLRRGGLSGRAPPATSPIPGRSFPMPTSHAPLPPLSRTLLHSSLKYTSIASCICLPRQSWMESAPASAFRERASVEGVGRGQRGTRAGRARARGTGQAARADAEVEATRNIGLKGVVCVCGVRARVSWGRCRSG